MPALAVEQPLFHCRFRTLGWKNVPAKLYLVTASGYETVEVRNKTLSIDYDYRGSLTLAFYQNPPSPNNDHAPLATLQLPQTEHDFILVFLPLNKKEGNGFRILPVPKTSAHLPGGSMTLINVTLATLGIRIEEENKQIPPLKSQTIPLPKKEKKERRRLRIPFGVFWKNSEGWEMLRSTVLFVPPETNSLLFPINQSGKTV